MRITRVNAIQVHPVPDSVHDPRGPFPRHLFDEPEIVTDYQSEEDDGTSNLEPGATAQNNYRPPKYYRCKRCLVKVEEHNIQNHDCDD